MKCLESLGKRDFTLDEVYTFEQHLGDFESLTKNAASFFKVFLTT
jgi:hypothetical protein